LNIIPPDGVKMNSVHPTANIAAQQGVVSRSMIVLTNFAFPKAGQYVFEFVVNNEVISREIFAVEKYEPNSIPTSKIN
jgi:hypothetical protein